MEQARTTYNQLLACDMDGTVIPLDRRPSRALEIAQLRRALARRPDIAVAYITGRHLDLARQGVRDHRLPPPDVIVCDVGTSVYLKKDSGEWRLDAAYARTMKRAFGGHRSDDVAEVLEGDKDLAPQEPEKQSRYKRSYYVRLDADRKNLFRRIRGKLSEAGIRANLVFSVDPKKKSGLLDILPRNVAKDTALRYLQRHFGVSAERVVFAGDSGNDMLAFTAGYAAIVVANTPEPVKEVLRKWAERTGRDTLYFARARYARGVHEGCKAHGML